jgi:hypothetical protein
MTYQEALQKEKRWNKRCIIISLYHNKMILKNKKWNQRRTAKYLRISLGAVCEALMLAVAIMNNPKLEELSRNEALKVIR